MNEYMQGPDYTNNAMPGMGGSSDIGPGLKYANIILTVLLAVVIIASGVFIAMFVRLSKDAEKNSKEITSISKDLSSMENEVSHISRTVEDILEQGCTGNNNSGSNEPDDPYDPYWPEYGVEKPVLYIYSDADNADVHVDLTVKDSDMVSMWPAADDTDADVYSWNVKADTDGTLYDADGNEYSYIFWEASDYGEFTFDKGFCVAGSDTAEFLRTTLAEIGLTPKEYNEFIVYWMPRMQGNAYNLISFKGIDPSDEYNERFALSVKDAEGNEADSILRVMMAWKAVDAAVEIEAQEFESFERNGFTVVEWGGTEITGGQDR
ncbi:MAG: hypothetical protein J6X66_02005 [Lachnospiraceae bacterium]|nr:hypothetical protein [Lachnospiraceae bacterium]